MVVIGTLIRQFCRTSLLVPLLICVLGLSQTGCLLVAAGAAGVGAGYIMGQDSDKYSYYHRQPTTQASPTTTETADAD